MNDTTLIAVGDSFVFGHLGDDLNYETCWKRSWVSKLEKLGNFKESINLAAPGGSNHRSFRVMMQYLIKNYSPNNRYVILYGISDINRFEISMSKKTAKKINFENLIKNPLEQQYQDIDIVAVGPWSKFNPSMINNYVNTHFSLLSTNEYNADFLNNQILSLHLMFNFLNIEHYFFETICSVNTIKRCIMNKPMPVIDFVYNNEKMNFTSFLLANQFKPAPCHHFGDDANDFMANYLYKNVLGEKNDI